MVPHTYVAERKPVEAYLKLQGRFRHLCESTTQADAIQPIQARLDACSERAAREGL